MENWKQYAIIGLFALAAFIGIRNTVSESGRFQIITNPKGAVYRIDTKHGDAWEMTKSEFGKNEWEKIR